ncbi:MAG: hypothetical protein Q7R93_02660 [bacterium]|nr:hypothetical protein [bacterium]
MNLNLIDLSKLKSIKLIPARDVTRVEEVAGFVCDFYVKDIETLGVAIAGGYRCGSVTNIDHHAPMQRMASPTISSATLALDYARAYNKVAEGAAVVINHTDADSILTSGIMSGVIEPDEKFGKAAICADHTGAPDDIADMLQGLSGLKNIEYSFQNLRLLLRGKPLEPKAEKALMHCRADREKAKRIVKRFKQCGRVYCVHMPYQCHTNLFVSLLPEAEVILIHFPSKKFKGQNSVRVRLGQAAPKGLWLNRLTLPSFGGRWNAGSSERHGGVTLTVKEYADAVNEQVETFLAKTK